MSSIFDFMSVEGHGADEQRFGSGRGMPAGSDSPSEDEGTWEIRKEQAAGAVDFCVYLNGRRIGMEKTISDLWSLFAGVGVKSEDAERAIYELGSRRPVQVQLHLPVTKLHL